jgi:hypothetical protein
LARSAAIPTLRVGFSVVPDIVIMIVTLIGLSHATKFAVISGFDVPE